MSVDQLFELVKPPAHPVHTGPPEAWATAEKMLATALPQDFRCVCALYGSGTFVDTFIGIYNPFDPSYRRTLESELASLRILEQRTFSDFGGYFVFPDPFGLLPWGTDENGGILCWIAEGEPDEWPVFTVPHGGEDCERWDMSMTSFLAAAFTNRIRPSIWQQRFRRSELTFVPDRTASG